MVSCEEGKEGSNPGDLSLLNLAVGSGTDFWVLVSGRGRMNFTDN
jgi:hypothetical protein